MIDAPLAYAFGVGMVATFNPCGFAMLPAYVSYFLGLESAAPEERHGSVLRALAVGATMAAGFMVVFGAVGIVLDTVVDQILDKLPWVTIVLGFALVALGIAMLLGRTFTLGFFKVSRVSKRRELWSVFLFGVSYALVSLSCTIGLFIAVVSSTFDDANFVSGVATFLAYGLGMGLVLMVLTLAISMARQGLVRNMKRVIPYVNRISGALLVVAGAYVAYYGWYERRVQEGDLSGGGPANWVFERNEQVSNWIQDVGPVRIGLLLALAIAVAVTASLAWRTAREARDDRHRDIRAGVDSHR